MIISPLNRILINEILSWKRFFKQMQFYIFKHREPPNPIKKTDLWGWALKERERCVPSLPAACRHVLQRCLEVVLQVV